MDEAAWRYSVPAPRINMRKIKDALRLVDADRKMTHFEAVC